MGYYSVITNSITFSPPITYGELKESGFVITEARQNYVDKDIEVESFGPDSKDSDELWRITASTEDSYKAYRIIDDLKELVAILGPERTYEGYLHIMGEGDGGSEPDVWRLRVKDGKVEEVHPRLVWPE